MGDIRALQMARKWLLEKRNEPLRTSRPLPSSMPLVWHFLALSSPIVDSLLIRLRRDRTLLYEGTLVGRGTS